MGAFYPVFKATGITRTIEVHDLGIRGIWEAFGALHNLTELRYVCRNSTKTFKDSFCIQLGQDQLDEMLVFH